MLTMNDVHVYYDGIHAVKGINLEIRKGEIVTLIGSNGAGKSTTIKSICSQVKVKHGTIHYRGEDITNKPTHELAARGIVHVPEGRRVFPDLTVKENLEIGAFGLKDRKWIEHEMERCLTYFPRLKERLNQKSGTMSGGEQQMLAIGRGLMSKPDILMLDEPSMGLAPIIVQQIFRIIRELNREGMTILLVEQNANQALHVAKRGYVIQTGRILLEDTSSNLLANQMVKEAYLAN